jgi:hypothetical protein
MLIRATELEELAMRKAIVRSLARLKQDVNALHERDDGLKVEIDSK